MDLEEMLNLYLNRFKNDLWNERRFKLDEIIEHLQQLKTTTTTTTIQGKPPDSSTIIDDLIEFFKYLKEQCCGLDFNSDREWSELMNLMQISRKLNHKSVKLKDIVRNKQLIEANSDSIRKLNEKTRLCHNIELMLAELDLMVQESSIELPTPSMSDDFFFILSQVSQTKTYLQDRCKPLLYTLKFEIDNELIAREAASETWSIKIQNLSDMLGKYESFINKLHEFQSKLLNLKPLMSVDQGDPVEDKNNEKELTNSLNLCKSKFKSIQEVNRKLLESLLKMKNKTSKRKRGNCRLMLMNILSSTKNEVKFVDDLYDSKLTKALDDLDRCRKDLDRIMMNLRIEFGRFYFVNDIELLTIIALDSKLIETTNASRKFSDIDKQSLISKLFNNSINGFIVSDNKYIVGVKSPLNEVILIQDDPILIKKKVNIYSTEIVRILNECSRKLRKTLKTLLIESLNESGIKDREIDWSLPVQLINLAEHIRFCKKVESRFEAGNEFESLLEFYELRFKQLCSSKVSTGKADNNSLNELKKSAAISLTVQYISIIIKLKSSKITSKNDWNWIEQVRYYYLNDNDDPRVEVEIANARFRYRFDYLSIQMDNIGSKNTTFKRLISTQITDRCIHVASQAIGNFRLGANPYGPAGSGKTETIKALGHSLGCQVIVHNCTESNDSNSLEKLIFGLAHTGLWGCFDEFNRLSSSVLSTVSAALELVQTSLRENKTTIELASGEQMMSIDKDCAFFVTLNPGDETKYRGRRKLPTNLRNLFLPVSMIRVEIGAIVSENLLILSGELDVIADSSNQNQSEILLQSGHKFHLMIEWLKENVLETSGRCEWDLRFVMAVLRRLKAITSENKFTRLSVDDLIVKSIQLEIEPRLTKRENELFHEGAAKVFNSNKYLENKILSESLDYVQTKIGEKHSRKMAKFVLNLQELLSTRTGVLILGQSGAGKSTIWRLAQRSIGESLIRCMVINPRSCQRKELFGFVDPLNNKWSDGLLTLKVREAISALQSDASTSLEQVWIVLDGPIDPDWIESLNSVLDDNQVLTLSSGERLDFYLSSGKSIKLIFETTSINFASPATISRLGLIYIEDQDDFYDEYHQIELYKEQLNIFKNHFIARNNAKILANFSLFEGFKRNQDFKILIVSGAANQITKSKFIGRNLDKNEIIEYTCSQYTSSTHLQDLLTKSHNHRYLLIKNVQTIREEDEQWKTSTFLELLRFAITYNGYYDLNFNFQPLNQKFIIFSDNLTHLDPRILALSSAIQLSENEFQEIELVEKTLQGLLISAVESKNSIVNFTIDHNFRLNDKDSLFTQLGNVKLFEFSNSRLINDSLDALSRVLIDDTLKEKIQEGKLFILRELELRLLDEKQKSTLFHLLNQLKISQLKQKVNFLYIINSFTNRNSNYFEYFSSIGSIYKLAENRPISIVEFVVNKLNGDASSENISKFDSTRQSWIAEKLLIHFKQSDISDLEEIEQFIKFFVSLIDKLKTNLSSERKTLANGLSTLNQFERVVNNIKSSCQAEESRLVEKRKEIDRLMKLLDLELKEAHQKKEDMEELKRKQIVKTNEIDKNSSSTKQKLSKVEPLIASSKIEVGKHLKPEALNEIKSLRSPPKTIKDILDVLFVLLGIKDLSWTSIKAHLTKYSIKDELTNYDFQRNLNKSLLSEIELLIESKQDSFNKQQAERASKAIVPILGWIEATLEYGKVLTSLRPLNEQLANLKNESELLNKEAARIESETVEVNAKIQDYSGKLDRLKQELDESQERANMVNEQLMKAQKVRVEMEDCIKRWRFKLESLESSLKGEMLIKLCLIETAIVFGYNLKFQEPLLKLFELEDFTYEKFLATFLNLIEHEREFGEYSIKPEETNRITQLLLIKLCLNDSSDTPNIPFIDMGNHQNESRNYMEKAVLQFLSLDNIFADLKKITVLKCQEGHSDWFQSIELSRRLNKVVLIDFRDKPTSFYLDIIDLISSRSKHQNSKLKCILMGNLEECDPFKHMLRPIKINIKNHERDCSIKSTILEHLVKFYDPELSKSVEHLELELFNKQIAARLMEKDLLKQLANVQKDANNELGNDLVKILSELYRLSGLLEKDMKKMREKLDELRVKQNLYLEQADKAAYFYKQFIADLHKIDSFYHMSLNSYIELLVESGDVGGDADKYQQVIINKIMLSMRCEDRHVFSEKLRNVGDRRQQVGAIDVDVAAIAENTSQSLRSILLELLIEKKEENKRKKEEKSYDTSSMSSNNSSFEYKLAIVMHDPTKSSPQAEIDEFFRQQHQSELLVVDGKRISCCYSKIYATGESSPEHLEFELRKLSSNYDSSVKQRQKASHDDGNDGNRYVTTAKCLCIANAHLSANWLNSHLLKLLHTKVEKISPTATNGLSMTSVISRILTLVILVGEKEVGESNVFSEEILDCAKIRYWHDELALNLANRYDQLSRSMLFSSYKGTCNHLANSTSNIAKGDSEILLPLAKQLILFHVVCQELTKVQLKSDATTTKENDSVDKKLLLGKSSWKNRRSYNFDYDLLCLAFKTLKLLWKQSQRCNSNRKFDIKRFRLMFGDYLKNIIYGSRMESLEDELKLDRLIARFISSTESGKDQLNKLEGLKSVSSGGVIVYDRLLASLIDEL